MKKHTKARLINGVLSAVLMCFFVIHGALGSASAVTAVPHRLAWLSWVGAALVAFHIIACIVTSEQQLTDTVRPPSDRKKRHLVIKWVTGSILVACLIAHIVCTVLFVGGAEQLAFVKSCITALLALAIAVHACFGAKSLLKDLEIDRRYRMPFRIVACVLAAIFGILVLASVLL